MATFNDKALTNHLHDIVKERLLKNPSMDLFSRIAIEIPLGQAMCDTVIKQTRAQMLAELKAAAKHLGSEFKPTQVKKMAKFGLFPNMPEGVEKTTEKVQEK